MDRHQSHSADINMKIACTILATLALALGYTSAEVPVGDQEAAPYPASGWKPSGRLLLLPVRQQEYQPSNEYGPPEQISATEYPTVTPQAKEQGNVSSFPASEQLQQQPGVNSGVYHVLLPDGRLQRVEFTAAPLKSDAAQSFTSPLQYQQQQVAVNDNSFNGQYSQQQPQEQVVSYEIQKSQNYELPPVQQFAFPGAFPGAFSQPNEGQSSKFTQGQTAGQSGFQKPSFQQNQFGLNTFEQTQTQQNQFGQSSFQQSPRGVKYQASQPQTSGFSQSSNAKFQQQQQRQYLSPRPNYTPESQSSQSNAVASGSSGKYTSAQQQQYQPQVQPQVFGYQQVYFTQAQQSEQSDAEAVPSPPESSGFVANVQYKDVEPIPGPIYSYNPAPLVRILRKTE